MQLKEIELIAGRNEPMPDELNSAEQLLFLSLRMLYIQHALGKLTVEQARTEKTRIIKEYETNALKLKCWEEAKERERKLAFLTPLLKDSGCELCRKYTAVMNGSYRKEKADEQ